MSTALLLSGGMDSIAIAFWKRPDYAITVNYGQLSAGGEIEAAVAVTKALEIPHEVISVDCSSLGSGDLAGRPAISSAPSREWWPFRNQLIITFAAIRGISLGIDHLLFGSVKTDDFHKDGTQRFFENIDHLVSFQEGGIAVTAPAISLTTPDLIKLSGVPRSLLAWAHSCHVSDFACGQCRGCYKYQAVLLEMGYETD